ncbi:hypothetical protein LOS78_05735 [Paracoccus sp. MA]|uniref:hypothetical protein n=1 Tax=Paracoccus sp. MA TaxID=2895796 RepID=UPI001E301C02|nr:hypothetical protein [Paracoccus sp. MA]UFM63666.1 hypothetical protein LOS78_05735 [Paracoccus sp. MA]
MNARLGNLAGKPSLGLKQPKAKARPDYLAAVRQMPCIICEEWGLPQLSRTEAHHVFHGRFSQRKTPDEMAVPLCLDHHEGNGPDKTKIAIHLAKTEWREVYGNDFDYTPRIQDRLRHLLEK